MAKSNTIYLADDDADDRFLLIEAFTSIDPDIKSVETENGQELLAILKFKVIPDSSLIILDMNMPKMNGLETLANLLTLPHLASFRAIMLSTSSNPEMIKFAKQLGAVDYFIKPSTMDGLLDLSNQLILKNLECTIL